MKVLFCHIPKSAGTSVGVHIAKQFADDQLYAVDQVSNTLSDFVQDRHEIVERFSLIAGHVPLGQIEDILPRFDLILAVVRHPIERLISMYKFMRMMRYVDQDIPFEKFFREVFSGNIATRNEQCGYIGRSNLFKAVVDRIASLQSLRVLAVENLDRLDDVLKPFGLTGLGIETLNVSKKEDIDWNGFDRAFHAEVYQWFDGDMLLHDYLTRSPAIGPGKVSGMISL